MIKKLVLFMLCMGFCIPSFAIDKVAIVDIQKVVNNSSQVKALQKEQEAKKKELVQFVQKANTELKAQTDETKKKALSQKYEKELAAKREANTKAYKAKVAEIDKNINSKIIEQAKAMGYDLVLTKGVVLYGGDDITEQISKVVK